MGTFLKGNIPMIFVSSEPCGKSQMLLTNKKLISLDIHDEKIKTTELVNEIYGVNFYSLLG